MAGNLHLAVCACSDMMPKHAFIYENNRPISPYLYTQEMCVEFIEVMVRRNDIPGAEAETLKEKIFELGLPVDYDAFLLTLPANAKNVLEQTMNSDPCIEPCPCGHPMPHILLAAPNKKCLGDIVSNCCFCKNQAYIIIAEMSNKFKIITKEQADKLRTDVDAASLPQTEEDAIAQYAALPEEIREEFETKILLQKFGLNAPPHSPKGGISNLN